MMKRLWFAILSILMLACEPKEKPSYPAIADYNLNNPAIIHLKTYLDEISGIVYYPKDTSIFAINDELGVLYKIYVREQVKIKQWKFSNEGDYEDLVLVDSTFYVLQSDGNIKTFRFLSLDSVWLESSALPLAGSNEFETLYYDAFYQKLFLICKDCASDNKKNISVYSFDPDDLSFSDRPFMTIDAKQIARLLGENKVKFKASAAAIHPLTKELYIISAVNKALVIASRDGQVKQAIPLDPSIFKQPEGINFTPEGHLLISNESAELGAPNILIFKYKQPLNENN